VRKIKEEIEIRVNEKLNERKKRNKEHLGGKWKEMKGRKYNYIRRFRHYRRREGKT